MSKLTTGVTTFIVNKSNGYKHVGVNSPLEERTEMNTKINNVLK